MLALLVLLQSSHIMVADFRTHRISNVNILILTALLSISPHWAGVEKVLISILIAAIIFILAKIGMGDLKLMIGLMITQGQLVISADYFRLVALFMAITLISQLIVRRSLKSSIAFAHILLAPLLVLYLAI